MPTEILLKLTAMTAIAHQDASPQANNGSNTKPFNRSLTKINTKVEAVSIDLVKRKIEPILPLFPVYPSTEEMLNLATGGEMLAALFVAQYPLHFGSRDGGNGEGLFTGIERYEMLTKKLQDAATFNLRISSLYQSLTELLCLSNYYPESQLLFAVLPASVQSSISIACLKNPQFVVALARQVAECTRESWRESNNKEKKNVLETLKVYEPTEQQLSQLSQAKSDSLIMAIPDLSGNSIGYQIRSAIALDLLERLGVAPEQVPTGSRYLLFHGGQRSKGVKTPSNADSLEAKIRKFFPILDAMGGCPDAFLMTEGRMKLQAHILCAENNWITSNIAGLAEDKSIFEMLDFVTMTRPKGDREREDDSENKSTNQKIFAQEVLCKGTAAILKLIFLPYTQATTIGAVQAGIDYWKSREGVFGGKSARNFGRFDISPLINCEDHRQEYFSFIETNKAELIAGLIDGSFCSGKVVCNAGVRKGA